MSPDANRCLILLSHANPEDNAATIWFATQLANEGYRVWSDVIDLAGGEDFWGGIEEIIRHRAAKVVYLLSSASNTKEGCLRELSVAQGVAKAERLKDFVIPLRIGDLAHNDANIRIHPLNILEARSWNVGLAALLEKLVQDAVPHGTPKDFRASSAWWKARFATSRSVRDRSEILCSNWFRVASPKLTIHWHRLGSSELTLTEQSLERLPWPAFTDSRGICTFAPADALAAQLPPNYAVTQTVSKEISSGADLAQEERNAAFRLCVLAWHAELQRRGLVKYELANFKYCFAFPQGLVDGDEIAFQSAAGKKGYRAVVGYKTRIGPQGKSWKRYWHFAVQPIPAFWPELMVMFRTHVLFSEDGKTLWQNSSRIQRARRNQCKNWWNDAWRDRLLAVVNWLARDTGLIAIGVGAAEPLTVFAECMHFKSPVTYVQETNGSQTDKLGGSAINQHEQEDNDDQVDSDDGDDRDDEA